MPKYLSYNEYAQATKDLPNIPYLETMLSYACTLSCKSCTNYSDYGMKGGYLKWADTKPILDQWFDRIRVECFGFIGGEPLMNPELETWIREFRREYPYTMIMLVTNAQLFMKNLWLLDVMEEVGMIYLKFSVHQPDAEYIKEAKAAVLSRFDWVYGAEVEGRYFYKDKILDFVIAELPTFMKTYQGEYGNMKPYSNNPNEAFKICNQQICPLLYDGKLYKCSSLGMLERVLSDHNQIDDIDWQPYLNQGLDVTCSDEELNAWAENFGKPVKECKMCPTTADNPFHPHYSTVVSRINIY
jgi:sulfatase maturation enzyme AslB (radical SAM superfamily)